MRRSAHGSENRVSTEAESSLAPSETPGEAVSSPVIAFKSPQERESFNHFNDVTSRVLTLPSDENNQTILSVILPMCLEDVMVLKAMLCVGASHLTNHLPLNATKTRSLTAEKNRILQEAEHELSSRVSSLHNLDSRRTEKSTQYRCCFTSYLLLYIYDVSEGTGNGAWQLRLDGARDIVSNALEEHRGLSGGQRGAVDGEKDTLQTSLEEVSALGIDEPLLQFFIYHDAVGRATAPRPRRMIIKNRQHDSSSLPLMLGINNSIMDFVARIAALRSDTGGEPNLSADGISEAVSIWHDIGNWKPSDGHSDLSSDYYTMCDVYIAACFVWLFFLLHPNSSDDDKVQTMICRGLESLSTIEIPELQSFALFPVFVIGMACTRQEDRETIEEQLDTIEQYRRFGNIRACRRIIRNAWTAYDGGDKQSWDWIRFMEATGMSVPLC